MPRPPNTVPNSDRRTDPNVVHIWLIPKIVDLLDGSIQNLIYIGCRCFKSSTPILGSS